MYEAIYRPIYRSVRFTALRFTLYRLRLVDPLSLEREQVTGNLSLLDFLNVNEGERNEMNFSKMFYFVQVRTNHHADDIFNEFLAKK